MRKYFYIAFLFIGFTSCDDGDIIINNFDFGDTTIKSCAKDGKPKVFFKINTEDVFESISLVINNADVSNLKNIISTTTDPISFSLDNNNKINYRLYDGTVTNDYFCNTLPPSNPKVVQEFISVGGTVVITTEEEYIDKEDSDGDGIDDVDELTEDTDGDGIMNVLDIDDDGDNVATSRETTTANDDPLVNGLRDTDDDGIPNYLDNDDDGDEILTREEVTAGDLFPNNPANANDADLAHYLNPFISDKFTGDINTLPNEISVKYRSIITIERLKLQNQDGSAEEIAFEAYNFGEFISTNIEITIPPTPATEDN
ncbi:hypothetical protein [Gillisia sp. JM1]|uniref:hypothetical protein n=1 Tax=Gillisia sp. JM1 TaxID=1283286 RepID=UPI00040B14C3|nr:hypothetical protein [Gillisia sp. JM1]